MKLYKYTNRKWNLTNLAFFSKIGFQGVRLVKKRPKNAQNKRFWAVFCTFALINRSANQQTIQLDVLHHDLKSTTSFEIFLAVQGVIFSKKAQNWSKIAYLMEYSVNVAHKKMLVLWIKELVRVLANTKIRLL